ncbi:hypothetical protein D3C83_02070 [compost metagenome]
MGIEDLRAHGGDLAPQCIEITRLAQYASAQRFESAADRDIPRRKTRPGERLMLPTPGVLFLVVAEARKRTDQQAARAVRA